MEEIKKIVFFYFSGTGNSGRISEWISEIAAKKGIDCKRYSIINLDIATIEEIDCRAVIFFISPIHGFNYPKIMLDFIRRFPKGNNRVVLMNTRAGMRVGNILVPGLTGIAFMISSLFLKFKGYKIVGQIPFDMPSNWISIHPALRSNSIKLLKNKSYERVKAHIEIVISGKSDFFSNRDIIQDLLISPIALLYYFAGRFALAKSYYASNDCDNCGVCIKQCPVGAIKYKNGRPYWTIKCESCMKCMNNCPKRAIETAHGLFLLVSLISSAATTHILNQLIAHHFDNYFLRQAISMALFFILLWVFYKLEHTLLRFNYFAKSVAATSLTHYKFWGRYKSS